MCHLWLFISIMFVFFIPSFECVHLYYLYLRLCICVCENLRNARWPLAIFDLYNDVHAHSQWLLSFSDSSASSLCCYFSYLLMYEVVRRNFSTLIFHQRFISLYMFSMTICQLNKPAFIFIALDHHTSNAGQTSKSIQKMFWHRKKKQNYKYSIPIIRR